MNLKITLTATTILLLVVAAYFTFIFQHSPVLFPKHQRAGRIVFYTENPDLHDNYGQIEQKRLMAFYEAVEQNLRTSTMYDSTSFEATVYFTKSKQLHRSYSFFLSSANSFCLWKINGNIYMYEPFLCVELETRIVETLSHELTHKMLLDQLGKAKYGKIPKWLMEGYCEFVAKNDLNISTLQHNMHKTKYIDGTFQKTLYHYDNYLLAVCYLLIYEKHGIEQLFNAPPDYEEVLKKIEKWNFTPHNTLKIRNKSFV